jgi:hypothetical protein
LDRKNLNSAVRVLALRKAKALGEAARLQSGLIAGSALHERLLSGQVQEAHADLTTAHILRTVDVLERGLKVLREQQCVLSAAANRADRASDVFNEKLAQSRVSSQRAELEHLVIRGPSARRREP